VNEKIAALEKEILERRSAEAEQEERIAELLSSKSALEKQGREIVRLAEDLALARDQAEDASRTKSMFLATMSHELRTPLNAIIGFSELIGGEMFGPVGNDSYREYANDIRDSGQHLLDLINNILDLSKCESGSDDLHEENIEISELTRSARWLVTGRAQDGNVELATELSDDAPMLRADKLKLKQILINLLSNAIKFTDTGGKVTLKAWCSMNSGYVFQVVDTGIGIALEDIPKALSPFHQIDNRLNRRYQGTGLGLPLSKSLIEMHGGSLDLQSQVGVGTTVTVRFPAERIVPLRHDNKVLGTSDRKAS
jgi:signal transduction histidine kinase